MRLEPKLCSLFFELSARARASYKTLGLLWPDAYFFPNFSYISETSNFGTAGGELSAFKPTRSISYCYSNCCMFSWLEVMEPS